MPDGGVETFGTCNVLGLTAVPGTIPLPFPQVLGLFATK